MQEKSRGDHPTGEVVDVEVCPPVVGRVLVVPRLPAALDANQTAWGADPSLAAGDAGR